MMDLSEGAALAKLGAERQGTSRRVRLRVGPRSKILFDVLGKVRQAISEVWVIEPARRFGVRNTEQNVTGVFGFTARRLTAAGTPSRSPATSSRTAGCGCSCPGFSRAIVSATRSNCRG